MLLLDSHMSDDLPVLMSFSSCTHSQHNSMGAMLLPFADDEAVFLAQQAVISFGAMTAVAAAAAAPYFSTRLP